MTTESTGALDRTEPESVQIIKASDLVSARHPLTPMRARCGTKENSRFEVGRRDWVQYLDPGIAEASGGRLRAQVLANTDVKRPETTGWHYHECEMQLNYIIKGWVELQFEDGTQQRLEAGDFLFMPGGVKHNEIRVSDEFTGLEVVVPAEMGTVVCDVPEAWRSRTDAGGDDA